MYLFRMQCDQIVGEPQGCWCRGFGEGRGSGEEKSCPASISHCPSLFRMKKWDTLQQGAGEEKMTVSVPLLPLDSFLLPMLTSLSPYSSLV